MSTPTRAQTEQDKPSGYINVASTISPIFNCCLKEVHTNVQGNNHKRDIGNSTPRSRKSFFMEESREGTLGEPDVSDIIVEE